MIPEGNVYNAQGRINRISVLVVNAYEVAVKNGFEGTVDEWLESLVGDTGKSAYEYAKENGYEGTEWEFAEDLSLLPGIIKNASTAIQSANTATSKANTATQNANTAAQNANNAATEANNARVSFLETAGNALEEIRNIVNDGTDAHPIVNSTRGEVITLNDSADRLLRGLKVFGKTEQNGIPTPEAPVPLESVGDVAVTVAGKNLIPFPYYDGMSKTINGVTFTVNSDGSVHAVGEATGDAYFYFCATSNPTPVPSGYLTVSSGIGVDANCRIQIDVYENGEYKSTIQTGASNSVTRKFDGNVTLGTVRIAIWEGTTADHVFYPQLEVGSTETEWEPYKGSILSITTPNGLPGIPVESGGNYTDSTGKQWICDEVDFAGGKYIQRIGKLNVYEASVRDWGTGSTGHDFFIQMEKYDSNPYVMRYIPALCNSLPYHEDSPIDSFRIATTANSGWQGYARIAFRVPSDINTVALFKEYVGENCEILYQLKDENPIPLTAEQLAAFAALHSNYPNTTVFNDKNAGMEVKYVADTKLYIDQKFAELSTALLNQ